MQPEAVPRFEQAVPVFTGCFLVFMILFSLLVTALMVWVYCRIFSKAGYSWALGLLTVVPIANLIILVFLAFANWPIEQRLSQLQGPLNAATQQ
jgi:uncharacterized membrane protein (DUF485 family)